LSGFQGSKFSRAALKDLLASMEMLPCMRALNLSRNGIDDTCEAEVLSIFALKQVTNIDLSQNLIGKKLATDIGRILRDSCGHISWIDLTSNQFDNDP
jgi:hypothetical protein